MEEKSSQQSNDQKRMKQKNTLLLERAELARWAATAIENKKTKRLAITESSNQRSRSQNQE